MSLIQITTSQLEWEHSFNRRPNPSHLRGAVANAFKENDILHQHLSTGVAYRYPLIQYRNVQNKTILVGFQEGAELLLTLPLIGKVLRLGEETNKIIGANVKTYTHKIQQAKQLKRYSLLSPWLPFNQERYKNYRSIPSRAQIQERDRLSVAGILVALRGLGISIDWQLYSAFEQYESQLCQYKNNRLHGVMGTLITNADLPEHFAIGKATSHGFGWMVHSDTITPV